MNVSALVVDFAGVILQAKSAVPEVEHLSPRIPVAQSGSSSNGYQVLDHFELNAELLAYLREFNLKWPVILFTDGRLHVLPEIAPELEGIFKRIVAAEDVGYAKTESEAYLGLAYRIGRSPQELLYVDDHHPNLEAAQAAGCAVHRYTGNAGLIQLLAEATR